jgi:hypothetical protein
VTNTSKWEYFGVGCFSTFAGLAGGAMIAVLVAKIVGAARGCSPEADTGAPCNWFTFMVFGAVAGAVLTPVVSVWFFRRGRMRSGDSNMERG